MLKLKDIDIAIDELLDEVIEIRQKLHAHPELSLKEYNTSEFIRAQLSELDIEVLSPFLSTDVVALLNGEKNEKNVTLRADMDALPIIEENTMPYRSTNSGVMHACGHDGHTAMLLGATIILEKFKTHLDGSVRFVFQPGEEVVAAGRELVEKGILTNPNPDVVLALHGWPGYPTGAICSRPGALMAAADFFKIKLSGKGGHGSSPDQQSNPIVAASKIVTGLTSIPENDFKPEDLVVINISKFVGGTTSNVIPTEVIIEGSVRYFDYSIGEGMQDLFEKVLRTTNKHTELDYELNYNRPYIATVNDSDIINECKSITMQYIDESGWIDIPDPVMSSEDFSYYIHRNPGGMFFLGMGEKSPGLHTNSYDFNDKALRNGIKFLVMSTILFLSGNIFHHDNQ